MGWLKKNIWAVYVIFFTLLLTGFYLAIFRLPNFRSSKLAVINASIPNFKFVNQDGRLITQKSTAEKVYVAEYFFTSCKGICPRMNANMRRVYDKFRDEKQFMIISHTCMPEDDSIPQLKAYQNEMLNGKLVRNPDGSFKISKGTDSPADTTASCWNFVTGEKEELYRLARQGYKIDNGKPDSTQIENQFLHTQFFALVDKYGRVRGIYDGLKEDEVQKLMTDIDALLDERYDHQRFMNGFSNNPG